MPYAIMVSYEGEGRTRSWEPTGITFEDGKTAGEYAKQENAYSMGLYAQRRYRAIKITDDNPLLWREREQRKFDEGIYRKPPWEDYFSQSGMYEHIDPDDPTKIRFIPTNEDGLAGRYTRMSPGRFINKYLGPCEPSQLDKWCAQMGLEETTSELKIARTAEEILNVYTNGPHSCMAYPMDHSVFENVDKHPVTVYGDSDLGVAYIERYGEITARCLVWPDKKQFGRIYGDRERLLERLKGNDYVENWDFSGAKIKLLLDERRGWPILPYIDGEDLGVEIHDTEWFILTNKPHIICKRPDGLPSADRCSRCGAESVWLTGWRGPDDDYDEPEYICTEGCKE